jgi:hypothetical protein
VRDNELYIDWPWGRGRLKEYQEKNNNGMLMLRADATLFDGVSNRLLLNTLQVLQVNDSAFLMGGEEAWLPWLTPFPSFANAPSLSTAEMPWPWAEAYVSAKALYDRAVENNGTVSVSMLWVCIDTNTPLTPPSMNSSDLQHQILVVFYFNT